MIYHIPWIYLPIRTALAIWHQLTKSEIPELAKASVLMRDRSRVEETIQAMQRAGPDALQVISDFDMTLSRFAHNGKRCPTTHNILDNDLLINDACKKMIRELLNTYYPIEIDATRTVEEKLPHMVEWWTSVHELLIQQKIRRDLLAQAVKQSSAMLREGYKVFFDRLQEQQVPLLIFSAGLGDILEEVIRQNHVFHPNVHVISNYMDFDQSQSVDHKCDPCLPAGCTAGIQRPVDPHVQQARGRSAPRGPLQGAQRAAQRATARGLSGRPHHGRWGGPHSARPHHRLPQ
ncbi:7-methylguanosine phosphate-specific 5'-nucleotidase isoform X2 [Salvelinus sp. IW2-2015]|uniref:7-methylguanosine phosphate-specific 5'-nucleotidase isoform X2 n=1 Tax=Salvelinus sp. IW2-2015 TaxID=2691554 RepID=UPI000CDFF47D|nr:7-methylguanosine phosphate-specific 5'-nucleotidase isoform X2 [Salvelinus alpinus]